MCRGLAGGGHSASVTRRAEKPSMRQSDRRKDGVADGGKSGKTCKF